MITFAIPFYSKVDYLKAAIDSVLKQTRSDWKLIVCDDCGPDGKAAQALVESYGDPRMRFYRNDRNLGLGGNWNRCLDLVETDLVNLLHNDDVLLPNYAETMLQAAERWPDATAFFCRAAIIDPQGNPTFSFPDFVKKFLTVSEKNEFALKGSEGVAALLKGNFIMCPTLTYRRSKLGSNRFEAALRYVLDLEMTTRILIQEGTLVGLPDVAYAYRRHPASTSAGGMADMTMFEEEVLLYERLRKLAQERQWSQAAETAAKKRIIKLQVGFYAAKDFFRLHAGNGVEKLKYLVSIG